MKKIFRKEVLIGLIVAVSLAVLFVGIDFLKGVNVFKPSNYYVASYTNVAGLSKSAAVTVNGFKVGNVRDITYEYDNPGHVLVELALDRNLRVPVGTKAVLTTDLLGTATIALEMSKNAQFHEIGDQLTAEVSPSLMDDMTKTLLPAVGGILPQVDSLLRSVNALVSDPAIVASVKRLDAITANLEATTRQLNAVSATLPAVMKDVKGITTNVGTMTSDLSEVSGNLKNVQIDSIAANLQAVSANLAALSRQLNDPSSSLGLLTHDPALYRNLNSTAASLDSLLIDIKRNPKRYISIKLL